MKATKKLCGKVGGSFSKIVFLQKICLLCSRFHNFEKNQIVLINMPTFRKYARTRKSLLAFLIAFSSLFAVSSAFADKPFSNSHITEVNDLKIHYRQWLPEGAEKKGSFFLIHGFGASTFSWEKAAERLQGKGYEVVAVDVPPFGYSDKSPTINQSFTAHAEMIHGLMQQNFPDRKWHLAGHSMGGGVAQAFALLFPETLESVTFVSAVIFTEIHSGEAYGQFLLRILPWRYVLGALAEEWFLTSGRIEAMLESAYGSSPTQKQVEAYLQPLKEPGTARAILGAAGHRNELHDLDAADLELPSLAIWGDEDTWVSLESRQKALDRIPGIEIKVLEGVGHNPMETHPEEFMKTWWEFIQGL